VAKKINSSDLVKEAYRYLLKKEYTHAVILLEKVGVSERENPYPHFLLAVACLYNNRLSRASDLIRRLKVYHPDFIPILHLEAFLTMKAAPGLDHALRRYIELNSLYPSDAHIHRGLKLIRKSRDFSRHQKEAKLHDYVEIPKPKLFLKELKKVKYDNSKSREENIKKFQYSLLIYSIIVVAIVSYGFYKGVLVRFFTDDDVVVKHEKEIDMVHLGGSSYNLLKKVNREMTPEHYISTTKLKEDFTKSKKLIKTGKYNEALFLLNRINTSNVNYDVKEKTNFLIKFVTGIDERNFENIPYESLKSKTHLYRGAAISWKGRIANFKKRERGAIFTLLVEYKNNDQFKGTAEIYSELKDNEFKNGDMVEVRGIFISSIGKNGRIHLSARGINRI
jgi:tetratricopeptide (TPR) repeat protein